MAVAPARRMPTSTMSSAVDTATCAAAVMANTANTVICATRPMGRARSISRPRRSRRSPTRAPATAPASSSAPATASLGRNSTAWLSDSLRNCRPSRDRAAKMATAVMATRRATASSRVSECPGRPWPARGPCPRGPRARPGPPGPAACQQPREQPRRQQAADQQQERATQPRQEPAQLGAGLVQDRRQRGHRARPPTPIRAARPCASRAQERGGRPQRRAHRALPARGPRDPRGQRLVAGGRVGAQQLQVLVQPVVGRGPRLVSAHRAAPSRRCWPA